MSDLVPKEEVQGWLATTLKAMPPKVAIPIAAAFAGVTIGVTAAMKIYDKWIKDKDRTIDDLKKMLTEATKSQK